MAKKVTLPLTDETLASLKAGDNLFFGPLQGAYPSCTIIPEPTSSALLSLGALGLITKRKKIIL